MIPGMLLACAVALSPLRSGSFARLSTQAAAAESVWIFRNWNQNKHGDVPVRKRIAVLGGIHGNERVGITIVERLVAALTSDIHEILATPDTELILGLGNLEAIKKSQRATSAASDLNRSFTNASLHGDLLAESEEGYYEQRRARELAPILETCDILVDIHATNKPSEPFVRIPGCCTAQHLHLASWFRNIRASEADMEEEDPTGGATNEKFKVLLDPYMCIGGEVATTDEYVNKCGGVALCLETGQAEDESLVDQYYQRVVELLQHESGRSVAVGDGAVADVAPLWGPYSRRIRATHDEKTGELQQELRLDLAFNAAFEPYTLRERVVLSSNNFEWGEGLGTRNWEPVSSGAVLLKQNGEDHKVTEDSVILFPKIVELCVVGKPVCWLASRVDVPVKSTHVLSSKPKETESLLDWYGRSQAEIRQVNEDDFLLYLYETPGRYRKNSSMPWRIISPTDAADPDFSVDSGNPFTKVELSRLNPATTVSIARRSDPFGEALKEYLEMKARPKMGGAKAGYPSKAAKLFLHFIDSQTEPIFIYPRVYSEHGTYFARSEEPHVSPRLTIPFTLQRAVKGKRLYFGVARDDVGNVSLEEVANLFEELSLGDSLQLELKHERCIYVSFAPIGDAHTLYDEAIGNYSPNVFVRGSFKDEVGGTYVALSRAMLFLSMLTKTSVKEVHPTFTKEGFIMKEMGVVRTPSVQLLKRPSRP